MSASLSHRIVVGVHLLAREKTIGISSGSAKLFFPRYIMVLKPSTQILAK